ncbi:MAG: TIGR00730 family Rossman fold protein [candidate division Zixibacteria bacterium]|nr:TIGR00730 family Rossman fold protein [candidate division Zixibacteria bacterium]
MTKKKTEHTAEMIAKLKRSPAYRIAYKDPEFMDSEYARATRLQTELLKTEIGMKHNNIKSTIVVFGGTRIIEPSEAEKKIGDLQKRLKRSPNDRDLKRDLRIAKAILRKSKFYDEAREFARLVSDESQQDKTRDYVIVTGGGPGVMEAANRGAHDTGAKSIGLNITLPMEQEPNAYISPDLCFQFHYFAIRKMHFLLRAKALVAFPGGYGTLDELFEALTLVQTGIVRPLPIVLFGEEYWKRLIDFDYLVSEGTIDPEDIKLFVYADKAEEAWKYIKYFWKARAAF